MSYKEVAEILRECLNDKTTFQDVIMKKYNDLSLSDLFKKLEEFDAVIDEVKSELGPVGLRQIYEYVSAPREEIKLTYEGEDGSIKDLGTVEGNIKFDPNGEIPEVNEKPINDGKLRFGDDKVYSDEIKHNPNIKFGDEPDKEDDLGIEYPFKNINKSEIKFGDDNDRRNKPSNTDYIPEPIYGDEDKDINDILDNLGMSTPKGFEFGDDSVRKGPKSSKMNPGESAFVGPIINNSNKDTSLDEDFTIDDSLLIKPLDFPNSNEKNTNDHKSEIDMIMSMSEGNPGAIDVLFQMISNSSNYSDIQLCDEYGIRGSKLYMLNNDCCNRNFGKFKRTLKMIRNGVFSKEEIQENLNLPYAIPFIDDNIVIEGVPSYDEEFGPSDDKWNEFCNKNKEEFLKKLNSTLGKGGFGGK